MTCSLMWDAEQVLKASRSAVEVPPRTDESDADVIMRETQEEESGIEDVKPVIAKPRKKREKKVVPVGKNGLKKKRIMKSRTRTDDKGYMGALIYHNSIRMC